MNNHVLARWLAVLMCVTLPAGAAIIRFDELPTQPVNGVSLNGATFTFTIGGVPSTDATFNSSIGPGATPGIHPPTLTGNANGLLTIDFAAPVNHVSFNIALLAGPLTPGAIVLLFDPSLSPAGSVNVDTPVPPGFLTAEGVFDYTGAPLSRIVIDPQFNTLFALDDLVFDFAPGGPNGVPLPPALCAALPLAGLIYLRRAGGRGRLATRDRSVDLPSSQ